MTKAEHWQQHVTDWDKSGLTQVAYCAQKNIKQNTFYYWRQKLSLCAHKPNKLIPVTVHSAAPARILFGSQVAIELAVEDIADLLLTLKDRGLLHASS
jgi:hypothetical protein